VAALRDLRKQINGLGLTQAETARRCDLESIFADDVVSFMREGAIAGETPNDKLKRRVSVQHCRDLCHAKN
jgi:hypothetical protein